jgi:hypothetical protein
MGENKASEHKNGKQAGISKKVFVGLKRKNNLAILDNWSILKEKNKIVSSYL